MINRKLCLSKLVLLILILPMPTLSSNLLTDDAYPPTSISTFALSSLAPVLKMIIDLQLYLKLSTNESFLPLETIKDLTIITKLNSLSCNSLQDSFPQAPNLFYIYSDINLGQEILIQLCDFDNDKQDIYGLITLNIKNHAFLTIESLISSILKVKTSGFYAEIFPKNLCAKGQYTKTSLFCIKNQSRVLSELTDFDDFVDNGNTIPEAINIFVWDTDIDLYNHMVSKIITYETPIFDSCYEVIPFASAIQNLMSFSLFNYQSLNIINLLYALTSKITCILNDYNEYPEVYIIFLNIQALYLNYYTTIYDTATDLYAGICLEVDDNLRDFIITATNRDKYTLYNDIKISSDHESLAQFSIRISLDYIKTTGKDIQLCTCGFCNENTVLSEINIFYYGFYNDADSFSVHIYQGGTIDLNTQLVVFTDQVLADISDKCYTVSIVLELYNLDAPNGYECKNFDIDSSCNIESFGLYDINIIVFGSDVFWVKRKCTNQCALCSENPLICTFCNDGYYIDDNYYCSICHETCNKCQNSYSCTECMEGLLAGTQLCQCENMFGFIVNTIICEPCFSSYCVNCLEDYTICDICNDGYYKDNNICSKCLEICKSCENGNTCLVCGENASGPIDGICTCNNKYGKNVSGACEPCADTLCEICAEGKDICDMCQDNSDFISEKCTCSNHYGIFSNTCIACADQLCLNCESDYGACTECVEQAFFENYICSCIPHASYSLTEQKCLCDFSYVLVGDTCQQGYLYLRQSDILNSYFDSVFSSITIFFSVELDTSISSSCPNVLTDTSKLGSTIVCSFPTTKSFKIVLGLGWTITNNDTLYINSGYLLRASGEYLTSTEILIIYLAYSTLPYSPIAIITGPSSVSIGCSTGSFEFSSEKSSGISSDTFTYKWTSSLFNEIITSPALTLLSSLIPSDNTFTIQLTVTDKFLNTNTVLATIEITTTQVLTISLDTGSSLTMKSSDPMTIQASITDYCGQKGTPTYIWTGSSNIPILLLSSSSNKLIIPSQSLSASTTPYVFYVNVILNNILGSNSVSITVKSSDIVILTNRPPGDVTSAEGFYIDASKSYDPDNSQSVLSFIWSISPISIIDSTISLIESSYSIPGNNLIGLGSFIITLTVMVSDRSSSITNTYTIIDNVNTVISMIVPSTKIVASKKFLIATSIESTINSIIKWTKISGPDIDINPDNYPYLSFMPFDLQMGTSYTFQIKVTEASGGVLRSYSSITTNIGPECSGVVGISPSVGVARKTLFKFQINNCRDLDGPDIPLLYTFGYTKGIHDTTLKQSLKDNFCNSKAPSGTIYPWVKVCDSLKDCIIYRSTTGTLISTSRRRLTSTENLIQSLEEDSSAHGFYTSLTILLDDQDLDIFSINTIWEKFTIYINSQQIDLETSEIIIEIIRRLIFVTKKIGLGIDYVAKYIEFVTKLLEKKDVIENVLAKNIMRLASEVLDLGISWDYIQIAHMLVLLVFKNSENPSFIGMRYQEDNLFALKIERAAYDILREKISVGPAEVAFKELSIENDAFITVEAVYYYDNGNVGIYDEKGYKEKGDTMYFAAFSERFYDSYYVKNRLGIISLLGIAEIKMLSYDILYDKCFGINNEKAYILDCLVKKADSMFVTLSLSLAQNGFYSPQKTFTYMEGIYLKLFMSFLIFGFISYILLTRYFMKEVNDKVDAAMENRESICFSSEDTLKNMKKQMGTIKEALEYK